MGLEFANVSEGQERKREKREGKNEVAGGGDALNFLTRSYKKSQCKQS